MFNVLFPKSLFGHAIINKNLKEYTKVEYCYIKAKKDKYIE